MITPGTDILATSQRAHGGSLRSQEKALFQCLIVSADASRRDLFAHAAADSGWRTLVSDDAEHALESLDRFVVHLSVVDLVDSPSADFRGLLEKMAGFSNLLVVVCGNEGNIREEIWVRQLGAWLYLTGIEDGGCVSALCSEARDIVERLQTTKLNGAKAAEVAQAGHCR